MNRNMFEFEDVKITRQTEAVESVDTPEINTLTSEEISKLKNLEDVEHLFGDLYKEIISKGEIVGSHKKYKAIELIGIIDGIRRRNRFKEGEIVELEKITSANNLRDRVKELIEKDRIFARNQ